MYKVDNLVDMMGELIITQSLVEQEMQEKYNVKASYRYRLHPVTFKEGSMPVGNKDALKGNIINDGEDNDD